MEAWLTKVFDYTVEKKEIPRPHGKPYYANSSTQIGVLHTTEGATVRSAWNTLSGNFSAPHFIVGENRIVQCRPLTAQAAALHGGKPYFANANASLQIEMVGFSKQSSWLPDVSVLNPTIALLAWAAIEMQIPLVVPFASWVDDCSDMKGEIWAGNNSRRRKAVTDQLWPRNKGWWMHLEVPGQSPSWHWDCGAIKRTQMLQMAQRFLGDGKPNR